MAVNVRRVVTGHDKDGKAVVIVDEITTNVSSIRPGHSGAEIWSTEGFPVDGNDERDGGAAPSRTLINGTAFRVTEYGPGVAGRMHRTETIDYAVILSGEIVMELDDSEVTLRAGDVLVQRGTMHNWQNRSDKPCVVVFVLITATPVARGASKLTAEG